MKHQRILVVEDDAALANMYRMSLRFSGFDVSTAGDGISALESIEQDRPDLVVLDLGLPKLDGSAILAELHANPDTAQIPVIVVTGGEGGQLAAGADATFRKPCSPDLLLNAIEQRLAH